MNKSIFFLLSLIVISFNALGQDEIASSPLKAKFIVEGGLEYGGEEILRIFFTNGDEQKMRAGQGGYLAIGGEFKLANVDEFALRTTVGIKYNTTAADDVNIHLTRIPINVVGYYTAENGFRVGLGFASHQNVKLAGDNVFPDVNFTSKIGPRFEIGYKWVALTYTSVNYVDEVGMPFSASSFGVSFSGLIPGGY